MCAQARAESDGIPSRIRRFLPFSARRRAPAPRSGLGPAACSRSLARPAVKNAKYGPELAPVPRPGKAGLSGRISLLHRFWAGWPPGLHTGRDRAFRGHVRPRGRHGTPRAARTPACPSPAASPRLSSAPASLPAAPTVSSPSARTPCLLPPSPRRPGSFCPVSLRNPSRSAGKNRRPPRQNCGIPAGKNLPQKSRKYVIC